MPWYYAGPEAKPIGPLTAEELHALRGSGAVTADTFVIEHTGSGAADLAWKRYREIFPADPAPAPSPGPAPTPAIAPTVPAPAPAAPAPHPLFPSSGLPAALPAVRPTNSWCAWGFGLSLAGFFFSCLCIGALPALVSLVLCAVGLVQVSRNREQSGQGLAIFGLILSVLALLAAAAILCFCYTHGTFTHGLTITEQTSNDSE
jgi:hypothetical protein